MITVKLTGRTQHRLQTRWFGSPLLVLQVEENRSGSTEEMIEQDGGWTPSFQVNDTYWRDAKTEDLSTLYNTGHLKEKP
jgi:hypothetical protein